MKFITVAAVILSLAILLTGCSKNDGRGYIFKYDIDDNPRTLDPQTATSPEAMLIIANMFEGLLRLDEDGGIIPGAAGEYNVSDDGLTYTFYLRDDVYWSAEKEADGKTPRKCTAEDFMFAFRRLFSPTVKSANSEAFFCIKNGEKAAKGMVGTEKVGVTAVDEFTLRFELEYPYTNFPVLLTTTPAMPCSESFYTAAKGRYGLTEKTVQSNGAFVLHTWNYDKYSPGQNFLILKRSAVSDRESDPVCPSGLNFFIDEIDSVKNFTDGSSDCIVVSGREADMLKKKGYPFMENENAVWGFQLNRAAVFSSQNLRLAVAYSTDRADMDTGGGNDDGYRVTKSLIPDSVRVGGEFYRDMADSADYIDFDSGKAAEYAKAYSDERASGGDLMMTLIMPDDPVIREIVPRVCQRWQKDLGLYCTISVMSDRDFDAALSKGDYDIAAVRYDAGWNSPSSILRQFDDMVKSEKYSDLLQKAERAETGAKSAEYYAVAEKTALESAVFIPVCFQTEYFFYDKKSSDIRYNPFTKAILFRAAKRS
ncbi:peptide ABC transporter substrate-binding protein [Clostridia bacterium]|nr:peptide ABC transporter substrate-binding protein [Clostridia bacterium]